MHQKTVGIMDLGPEIIFGVDTGILAVKKHGIQGRDP